MADYSNLPTYTPGESSMDYMRRIGMNDTDATNALAYSRANPTASFQDIISRNNYNIPSLSTNQMPNAPIVSGAPTANPGAIGTNPASVAKATAPISGAVPTNPNTQLPGMQPGETAMQYYLRIGMDPNRAASTLTQSYGVNGPLNPAQFATDTINRSYQPGPEFQHHGGAITATPVTLNTRAGNIIGYDASGRPITQTANLSQGPEQKYYPGVTDITSGTPGTPVPNGPGAPRPTGGGALGIAGIGSSTPAGRAQQQTVNGGLPAFNPGESSESYMRRLGFNSQAIDYAMQLHNANPNASFQQILEYMKRQAGGGAGIGGTTSNQPSPPPGQTNPSASAEETRRRAAWEEYYAAQARKNPGLSSTGGVRYNDTPSLNPG